MIENDTLEFIKSISINSEEVFITYYDLIEDLKVLDKVQHDNIPEIIQATILNICNADEVKDCYLEFKEQFNSNKEDIITKFKNSLDTYCEKESLCIHCGSELTYETHLEDRGEYFGFPCNEETSEPFCPHGCKNLN